jgi:NADPH:quinone reductase-like Zn-dependent oxidoreductase
MAALSCDLVTDPSRATSIVDPEAAGAGGRYAWVRPDSAGPVELAWPIDEGRLTVHAERALPLAEAAEAWHVSTAGHTRGKLVIQVS